MGPVNNLWVQINRDKETIIRKPTRRSFTTCLLNLGFYGPGNGSDHTVKWKNWLRFLGHRLRGE